MVDATGIILAGGNSSRMGMNKALLKVGKLTVIERIVKELEQIVDDIIIVTNSNKEFSFLNLPMVEDKWKGKGPLAGIHAGLTASKTEKNLIVACDMPFISADLGKVLLDQLFQYQGVVPYIKNQRHPLFAAYRKEVKEEAKLAIVQEQLRIQCMLKQINVKYVTEMELTNLGYPINEWNFYNMNDPKEYQWANEWIKRNWNIKE